MSHHKRPHNGDGYSSASKRHHHHHHHLSETNNSYHHHSRNSNNNNTRPPSSADTTTTNSPPLPPLPPIKPQYQQSAFCHKSLYTTSREVATADVTYERLEFLGDAYIELFASRLIYESHSHLPAGRMSQLRELLVKNETLADFSRSYRFDTRIQVGAEVKELLLRDSHGRGNKGWNKILGDVFEAYVAAVVLGEGEEGEGEEGDHLAKGFESAERWCRALWMPKLRKAAAEDRSLLRAAHRPLLSSAAATGEADKAKTKTDQDSSSSSSLLLLRSTYDPNAKATLQKRIYHQPLLRLHYETDRPTIELKGDHKGQNLHFIALYVEAVAATVAAAGHENWLMISTKNENEKEEEEEEEEEREEKREEKKNKRLLLLAKGQGKNKVEAGNWAAIEAMYGPKKSLVDELERKVGEEKVKRQMEREREREREGK